MAGTISKYIAALYALMPKGLAWNTDLDSNTYKLVSSVVVEFCRVDERLSKLLDEELDPFKTTELIVDFENMLGLPEPCLAGREQSLQDRRDAIVQKLAAVGGASVAYFEALLDAAGFTGITITGVFNPFETGRSRMGDRLYSSERYFRVGSARMGDRLYNTGWRFTWEVHSATNPTTYFRTGESRCGDRLAIHGNQNLECLIRKLKPAHTNVIFSYGP